MATPSNEGDDQNGQAEGLRMTPGAPRGVKAMPKEGVEDNALGGGTFRINPEAMRGVPPLVGLEEVEVVMVQPVRASWRWTEGVLIHVVGSGIFAAMAFGFGLFLASSAIGAGGGISPQPEKGCVVAPVPEIKDRNG